MERDQTLDGVLEKLKARYDDARKRLAETQHEVRSLALAIQGLEGLIDDSSDSRSTRDTTAVTDDTTGAATDTGPSDSDLEHAASREGNGPRGVPAVEMVMRESPKPLTLRELTAELQRRGWAPDSAHPDRAVRASANRLRERVRDFQLLNGAFGFLSLHEGTAPWDSQSQTPLGLGGTESEAS